MLLSHISARQLSEWMAFYALDPWGDWREDRRSAMVGAMIAAGHGKKVDPDDLMLFDPMADRRKELKEEARLRNLRMWFEDKAKEAS